MKNINEVDYPMSWFLIDAKKAYRKISRTNKKIRQKEYLKKGTIPIVDQGQELIGGYTEDNDLIVNVDLPVVTFGDHSKTVKFINFNFAAGADGLVILKPHSLIMPKLFFYFLQVLATKIEDKGYARHFQQIQKQIIPIPPLPEQHRIVEKIEELFSELDNGVAALKKAKEQLKVYRQSVLKWAFEGRLTEEWRNSHNLISGKEVFNQIIKRKADLFQQKLDEWEISLNNWNKRGQISRPVKPKKNKEPIPLTSEELNNLPELPSSWMWLKLGEITWSVKDGPHFSPKYEKEGIPFISGGNIRPEKIDFKNVKYISQELHKELSKRCKPEQGDILYTKGGTTGIARVNNYNIDFNVWVHVAVLKITQLTDSFYIQNVLNSPHCYRQSQKFTHGVGNQDLGLTRMINITIPLCSTDEQCQIVKEIESRFLVVDNLEKTLDKTLLKTEALKQSILKSAFEGRLV